VVVLDVGLEAIGQAGDSLGQDRHLDLGRPGGRPTARTG
jgi:hypothetical protein